MSYPLSFHLFQKAEMKGILRPWNREVFGDLFQNIRRAEDEVLKSQVGLELSWTSDKKTALDLANQNLDKAFLQESIFAEILVLSG